MGERTQQHLETLKAIPEDKRRVKVRNTLVGLGAIAAGVLFVVFEFPFPWWFDAGLLVFGGFAMSQELVKGFFGFLPAAIKDIRAALKNGG